jgi:hypothetical protein
MNKIDLDDLDAEEVSILMVGREAVSYNWKLQLMRGEGAEHKIVNEVNVSLDGWLLYYSYLYLTFCILYLIFCILCCKIRICINHHAMRHSHASCAP